MPVARTAPAQDDKKQGQAVFARWKAEIDHAQKDKRYVEWTQQSEKIIKRYRDERKNSGGVVEDDGTRRLNILWSNVQTLRPAVYAKMPTPVVERRFMDKDPVARTASMILERTATFQMEVGYYHESTGKAVLDYLLPGIGQVWCRYEPQIEQQYDEAENAEIQAEEAKEPSEVAEDGDGTAYEAVAYEKVCVDYVFYKDFLWSGARCWEEVRWVGKRSYLTRSEIAEQLFDGDMEKAKEITLDYTPDRLSMAEVDETNQDYFKKAEIWELWNKADRKVYFIAPGSPSLGCLKEADDPLKLEGFWPCPEPLFTTQTNDTLIPVPDYHQYQDQAKELDDLTNRIARITEAVKAAGVYDSSVPSLARLLQLGSDNKLIPVDQWAAFAEKGGIPGAISLLPMKEIIEVLLRLYEARAQVKLDLYEVTGISDIVRGQGGGGAKTATEQRIKGQFASLRLEDRRSAVARFCRDTLRIIAEIVSEQFSEDSLLQMSGYSQIIQDEVTKAVAAVKPPQPPQAPQGPQQPPAGPQQLPPGLPQQGQQPPPGIDPAQAQAMAQQAQQAQMLAQQQAQQQFQMQQAQAQQQAEQKALSEFAQAVQLLRSDKLRGFRIDIETDSTVQVDAQADKEAAVELVTATFQGLGNAAPLIQQAPELIDPIGKLLMFVFRRFRTGKTVEASLDEALEQIKERMKGPQPPSPEQQKAEGEIKKQQMEMQRSQQEGQIDMASKQLDMRLQQQEAALKEREMQMEARLSQMELALKVQELKLKERELGIKMQATVMDAAIGAQKAELDMSANQQKHTLGMEALEAKTAAQKQAARAKPKGNGKNG